MRDENPPAALSVDRDDPRFRPDVSIIGGSLVVRVDGAEQRHVITYDVAEGFVLRFANDAEGRFVVEGDEAVTERIEGDVKVAWRT